MFVFDGAVALCGGKARFGLTAAVLTRAGWRRHHVQSIHARVCCRLEQRRCDGCGGLCKKCLRFVLVFDACERAGLRHVSVFCGAVEIWGVAFEIGVDCGRCWGGVVVA